MKLNQKHIVRGLVGLALFFLIYFLGQISDSSQKSIENTSPEQGTSTTPVTQENTDVQYSGTSSLPADATGPFSVSHVVDGDTVTIMKEGKGVTLRLIGINTPETVDPRRSVECFGKEASDKMKSLLNGKQIYIEADASQDTYDKYQRLLAYIFLQDGTNINLKMVAEGFAYEYTYDTPYKYQKEFKAAEANARTNNLGLWSPNTCGGKKTTTSTKLQSESQVASAVSALASNEQYICDRNAYNCTNFKTHAEAQTAYESCGGVANDIHKLDQDHDGLACETLP